MTPFDCTDCGAELPPYSGTGRPRVRCLICAASGAAMRAWRANHPEVVEAYNTARREHRAKAR